MWWEKNEKPEVGLELGKPACGVPTIYIYIGETHIDCAVGSAVR
jgi:hypothetical protein